MEYTNERDATQKPDLVELSVDKTQPVLLFQQSNTERCTMFDNFLTNARLPEATKELDSLAEIVDILVDDYYNDMMKKITNEEHKLWGSLPLSKRYIEFVAKDMYTAYKIWNRIILTQDGLCCRKMKKEEPPIKRARSWGYYTW
ncbi:hypothetical protein D1007_21418 [Hordeum vulgare]|nr:hypothetical protein D1007_21418 [Hordeum vulgare]